MQLPGDVAAVCAAHPAAHPARPALSGVSPVSAALPRRHVDELLRWALQSAPGAVADVDVLSLTDRMSASRSASVLRLACFSALPLEDRLAAAERTGLWSRLTFACRPEVPLERAAAWLVEAAASPSGFKGLGAPALALLYARPELCALLDPSDVETAMLLVRTPFVPSDVLESCCDTFVVAGRRSPRVRAALEDLATCPTAPLDLRARAIVTRYPRAKDRDVLVAAAGFLPFLSTPGVFEDADLPGLIAWAFGIFLGGHPSIFLARHGTALAHLRKDPRFVDGVTALVEEFPALEGFGDRMLAAPYSFSASTHFGFGVSPSELEYVSALPLRDRLCVLYTLACSTDTVWGGTALRTPHLDFDSARYAALSRGLGLLLGGSAAAWETFFTLLEEPGSVGRHARSARAAVA